MSAASGLRLFGLILAAQLCGEAALAASSNLGVRLKAFGTINDYPDSDVQREQTGNPAYDGNLDLRLMFSGEHENWRLLVDHSSVALAGDSAPFGRQSQNALDQLPGDDSRRAFDLTWTLDRGDYHRVYHRFDRLALKYKSGPWGLTLGRDAVSWGSGKAFNPLDLFTPFAPTTVDRDYKPGEDLLKIDRLLGGGGDLQLLGVFRRDAEGDREWDEGSWAGKLRGFAGDREFELAAGRHYEDTVLAVSLRQPLGGALLQSDWVATDLDEEGKWKLSVVVNIDYSFTLAQRTAYVFGEYYRNGFGREQDPVDLAQLPGYLVDRLQRGEVFTLMKDYLALGGSYQWHPLLVQSMTVLWNLHDGSNLWQSSLSFEPGDHQRLEAGLTLTAGSRGEEFARIDVAPGLTSGGGSRFFLRWVYYW